ncbi:Uncharacterised protein [uncultured archaeon]|nr:Uncharacterised protein [uncultured archaeon]
MNDAKRPRLIATVFTSILYIITLSAVASGSPYLKSISCCPAATSWCPISTSIPTAPSMGMISFLTSTARSSGLKSKYPAASCGSAVGFVGSPFILKRKNSSSGPTLNSKPMSFAFASARLSAYLGSPGKGVDSSK